MTNKQHHTVGTVPKSNRKIVERDKIGTLTYKNMTIHFHGSYRHLNKKGPGQTSFMAKYG
jgi:hypothetical protein